MRVTPHVLAPGLVSSVSAAKLIVFVSPKRLVMHRLHLLLLLLIGKALVCVVEGAHFDHGFLHLALVVLSHLSEFAD